MPGDTERATEDEDNPTDNKTWGTLLTEFTQETTLHGIRYVTAQSKFLVRRLSWAICLLAASAFFISFMTTKLMYYFEYPTVVNQEIHYNKSMRFPAVTLCNQNKFRLSAVQKYGMTDTLNLLAGNVKPRGDFRFISNICTEPETNQQMIERQVLHETSRFVCADFCANYTDNSCNGFFYNRISRQCIATTYPGYDRDRKPCNESDVLEYYKRQLPIMSEAIICTFEDEDCLFAIEKDEFSKTMAKNVDEWLNDVTLGLNKGHVLLLPNTFRKPDSRASLRSPIINTTDMCLELYYQVLGKGAAIDIYLEREDFFELYLYKGQSSFSQPSELFWSRKHIILPGGIYRVIIEAIRSGSFSSGVLLDDISVQPCDAFRVDCLRNKAGYGYMGDRETTSLDSQCHPWLPILKYLPKTFATNEDNTELQPTDNQCRNPLGSINPRPLCTVRGQPKLEFCDIPYCACPFKKSFQCEVSKVCLPEALKCDGHFDCEDKTDETLFCDDKKSVTCDFDIDDFMCGYRIDFEFVADYHFKRKKVNPYNQLHEPIKDSQGSEIGYFLYADPASGESGSNTVITSPTFVKTGASLVKFYAFIYTSSGDLASKITLNLITSEGIAHEALSVMPDNNTVGVWQSKSVCVPTGEYQLQFAFTLGVPYLSLLAIDDVTVGPSSNCVPITIKSSEASINCTFDSSTCGYRTLTSNTAFTWTTIPKSDLENVIADADSDNECEQVFRGSEGSISSPNYPEFNYDNNLHCVYTIQASAPTDTITINFPAFSLEAHDTCNYDALTIEDGVNSVSYCGERSGLKYETTAEKVVLTLTTDDTVDSSGFILDYYIATSSSSVIDKALVLMYVRELISGNAIAELILPPLELTETSRFLSFDLRTFSNSIVAVHSRPMKTGYQKELWYQEKIPDDAWKTYTIQFQPDMMNTQVQIVFFISTHVNNGVVAILDNIRVLQDDTAFDDQMNASCSFNKDACGYHNIGTSADQWMHACEADTGQCFMYVQSRLDVSVLESPMLPDSKTSMLAVFSCPHNVTTLMIRCSAIKDRRTEIRVERVHGDDLSVCMDLPSGCERLWFSTNYKEDARLLSVDVISGSKCSTTPDYETIQFGDFWPPLDQISLYVDESNVSNGDEDLGQKDATDSPVMAIVQYDASGKPVFSIDDERWGADHLHYNSSLGNSRIMDRPLLESSSDELFLAAAHTKEDVVIRCLWNNENCSEDVFEVNFTDAGVCYTFNGDPKSFLQISDTGSSSGLYLLLNVEQYEHMDGLADESGIKLYLHDQQEIRMVRDLGSMLPTGMHSMLAIRHNVKNRMKAPWGNCHDEPDADYPNEPYTRNRCLRACEAKEFSNVCQCKASYMPGSVHVCDINAFTECMFTNKVSSNNSCECDDACYVSTYSTDASYSVLPSNVRIVNNNYDAIFPNYLHALNTRERTNQDFVPTLTMFLDNMKSVESALTFVRERVLSSKSSIPVIVEDSIDKLLYDNARILNETMFPDHDKFVSAFNTHRLRKQKAFLESLDKTANYMNDYLAVIESVTSNYSIDIEWARQVEQEGSLVLPYAQWALRVYMDRTSVINNEYVPNIQNADPDLRRECRKLIKAMNDTITQLVEDWPNAKNELNLENLTGEWASDVDSDSWTSVIVVSNTIEDFKNKTHFITECVEEYMFFLSATSESLDGNNLGYNPVSYARSLIEEDEMNHFTGDLLKTTTLLSDILRNDLSMVKIAATWDEMDIKDIGSRMTALQVRIGSRILQPLQAHLQEVSKIMITTHTEAMQTAVAYSAYFALDKNIMSLFEERARLSLSLFRKPYLDINSQESIQYKYSTSVKLWPKQRSLTQFWSSSAAGVIREQVTNIINELEEQLATVTAQLNTEVENVKKAIESVQSYMDKVTIDAQLDTDFVRDNMMKVNIYYDELRYDEVSQKKAYDVSSFFSDMGGYMGLLLGASVITLVELIDVICFNVFLRCRRRKVAPQMDPRVPPHVVTQAKYHKDAWKTTGGKGI